MAVTESPVIAESVKFKASAERKPAVDNAKVCWIEVKRYPYQPDHQVELLHLQAEADALLIKLQASSQQRTAENLAV